MGQQPHLLEVVLFVVVQLTLHAVFKSIHSSHYLIKCKCNNLSTMLQLFAETTKHFTK